MADPDFRRLLREEFDDGRAPMLPNFKGGLATVFITQTATPRWAKYEGCTVEELAGALNKHPLDAFLDLVVDEDLKTTFQIPARPTDRQALQDVACSSVALAGLSDGGAHTKFITLGAYSTEFLMDVRDREIMGLEEAHWRLSGYPAYAAGLKDRGVLREGMPADIVIYDYDKLEMLPPEIAHDFPANEWRRTRKATGYRYIMVNGETTFVDGECTGATPGRLLRHGYSSPAPMLAAAE